MNCEKKRGKNDLAQGKDILTPHFDLKTKLIISDQKIQKILVRVTYSSKISFRVCVKHRYLLSAVRSFEASGI
jgi:hypothetical protein